MSGDKAWLRENLRWTPEKQEKKTRKWMANRVEWIRAGRPRTRRLLKFSKRAMAKLPKSYREAMRLGVEYYYTGQSCRRGHITVRKVNSRHCYECHRIIVQKRADRTVKMPVLLEPVLGHREQVYREIMI